MESPPPPVGPEVFPDYRTYLKAWLAEHPEVSQAKLARRVGRSKSWLSKVLLGELDLDPSLVSTFARALELADEDSRTLAALVDLDSTSLAVRRGAQAWLDMVRRFKGAPTIDDRHAALFARWWYVAILELARCADLTADPARIAALLEPTVAPADIEEALGTLRELGALTVDERGVLVPATDMVASPLEVPKGLLSQALAHWHTGAHGRAQEALFRTHGSERHYGALVFALPEESLAELRQRLADFERSLVTWCEAQQRPGDRVYQLAFALFPVSARVPRGPSGGEGSRS